MLEIPIQLRAVVHVESTKSSQRQLNFVHAIFVCSTKLNAFVFNFPRRNMNLWNWTWTESRWSEPIEKIVAFSISALEPTAKKKEIPVDIEIYLSQRKPLHFFVARFATFTCGERNTKIICPDMCENQSKQWTKRRHSNVWLIHTHIRGCYRLSSHKLWWPMAILISRRWLLSANEVNRSHMAIGCNSQ